MVLAHDGTLQDQVPFFPETENDWWERASRNRRDGCLLMTWPGWQPAVAIYPSHIDADGGLDAFR